MALIDNLVSYFKLDESSGNATDSKGSNTLTNTSTTYSTGKINNGAVFNGSAKLEKTSPTGVANNSYTFSVWAKVTSNSVQQTFISIGDSATADQVLQINSSGKPQFISYYNTGTPQSTIGATTLSINTFYHIVGVRDSSGSLSIYLNGVLDNTPPAVGSATAGYGTVAMNIGYRFVGQGTTGTIDEVGIWSRALTSTEVATLYNNGVGLQYPFINSAGFLSLL